MSEVIYKTITFHVEECCVAGCHIQFAMTTEEYEEFRNSHKDFYCPRGHGQHYANESDKERLQRLLRIANADKDRAAEMLREKEKSLDRMKRRAALGLCHKCNRYFKNVHRHMICKHLRKKK